MIPKIIHYCWFGKKPLPDTALKCIGSWRRFLPDYEIKEWNESNFDVMCCAYTREAYKEMKWAFVSDYARFWILYHYGGIYFDTDVEVIKDMSDIIEKGAFIGCEAVGENNFEPRIIVNPGLGMATPLGMGLNRELLDMYEKLHFRFEDGRINHKTVVDYATMVLKAHGLNISNSVQHIADINVYPPEYFCPLSYYSGEINITSNTRTIHHFTGSWKTNEQLKIERITQRLISIFGDNLGRRIAKILVLPFRFVAKVKREGLIKTIRITLCMKKDNF